MDITRPVRIQIDCRVTVCILPKHYLGDRPIPPRRVHLQIWIKTSLPALGKCKVKVKNRTIKKEYKVDFVIVGNHHTPLFSSVTAQKMDLISVHYDRLKAVIIQY